jgi:hypothetical protein
MTLITLVPSSINDEKGARITALFFNDYDIEAKVCYSKLNNKFTWYLIAPIDQFNKAIDLQSRLIMKVNEDDYPDYHIVEKDEVINKWEIGDISRVDNIEYFEDYNASDDEFENWKYFLYIYFTQKNNILH